MPCVVHHVCTCWRWSPPKQWRCLPGRAYAAAGVELHNGKLVRCRHAEGPPRDMRTGGGAARARGGQAVLQRRLFELIAEFGACTNCLGGPGGREDDTLAYVDLPIANLLFDGRRSGAWTTPTSRRASARSVSSDPLSCSCLCTLRCEHAGHALCLFMALHQLLRAHARFAMVHAITRSRMSRVSAAAPIVMFFQPNMLREGYTKLQICGW